MRCYLNDLFLSVGRLGNENRNDNKSRIMEAPKGAIMPIFKKKNSVAKKNFKLCCLDQCLNIMHK